MVDNMEIETAFHTLVGVIIVAVVIIAVIVIMLGIVRGSRTLTVQECIPSDYITTSLVSNSAACGLIDSGTGPKRVYCKDGLDTCMDPNANKCCRTSDADVVLYSNIRCCKSNCVEYKDQQNCTDASCVWCPLCSGNAVNEWYFDRCVAPGKKCVYQCDLAWCKAECKVKADCTSVFRPNCNYACRCVSIL